MSAARQPHPHESAHLHVAGEATYIDDIPELRGTLHCAIGMSTEAHATLQAINLDAVRAAPGVVLVITAEDIRTIRPGYGLKPKYWDEVIGKKLKQPVNKGQAVQWALLD